MISTTARRFRRCLVVVGVLSFWSLFLIAGTWAQGPGRPGMPPRPGIPPITPPPGFRNPGPNIPPAPKPPGFSNPPGFNNPGSGIPPALKPPNFNNPGSGIPPIPNPPGLNNPAIPQAPGGDRFGNHSMMGNRDQFGVMVWKCSRCGAIVSLAGNSPTPPPVSSCPSCGAWFANTPKTYTEGSSIVTLILVFFLAMGVVAAIVGVAVVMTTKKRRRRRRRVVDPYDPQFET